MSGLSFAINLLRYESVDSTSDEARRLLLSEGGHPPLPFVVWADRQTRGRGRRQRSWWSDEGSLTFTLALDPEVHGLRPDHEPRLSLIAGQAVLDTVDALKLSATGIGIRWPNDVEIGDRKLAGLLPEGVVTDEGRRFLIGIGLNLTTRFEEAPPEIARMAASLASLGLDTAAVSPRTVLDLILRHLAGRIRSLSQDDPGLSEDWNRIDLLRGRRVRIDLGTRILAGIGSGIGPAGELRVKPDDGGPIVDVVGGQVLRDRPAT